MSRFHLQSLVVLICLPKHLLPAGLKVMAGAGPVVEAVVAFVTPAAVEICCVVEIAADEMSYVVEIPVLLGVAEMNLAVEAAATEDFLPAVAMGTLEIVAEVAADRKPVEEP